jgi:N-acylglucosamine 2-epimerase
LNGILAFRDSLGKSTDFLEWDQKLWWVHVETLVALIMGYARTSTDDQTTAGKGSSFLI